MLGPYLATDITILNATAESLVFLVVVYIHISVKFHVILNFFSTICPIIVNDKCPNQSFMQLLARQHSLLRAAFEQFNLIFFEAHCTHISLNEASKVAAPRKKIVEKINVVEVELLVNNLMFVEAKDKIEIAEFQLQLLEFEEVIVAMLGEAMNVNQCFENRPEPNMHCVGRILEQQIGISSLGHSFNLSFFLVQSFKAIASKPNMLNLVTAKNNGVKMGEGLLADHIILRGRVTWAAMIGSCLYISCFYKFWDPGGFFLREGVIPVECEFTDMLLQSRIPFTSSFVNLYSRKDRLGLLDCACDVFDNTPEQYWEYRNTVDISMGDSDEPDISSA